MAAKKSEALQFTRCFLREKPDASFAEIRDAAAERDMKIYPIVFGRAKALEGLVKVAPYGSKKRAREAQQAAAGAAEAPRAAPEASTVPIERVISGMRANHEDRERYRAALLKISAILDEIL